MIALERQPERLFKKQRRQITFAIGYSELYMNTASNKPSGQCKYPFTKKLPKHNKR